MSIKSLATVSPEEFYGQEWHPSLSEQALMASQPQDELGALENQPQPN